MKTHIDTDRIKQAVDLRIIAERYTMLRKQSSTESAGPCPWCGGTDRFRVFADHFFCRAVPGHCGRKGDTIEFIVQRENVDFKRACEMLANGVLPTTSTPVEPVKAERKPKEWDEAKHLQRAITAHNTLISGTGRYSQAARDYLSSRALTLETMDAFKLGFCEAHLPDSFDYASKTTSYPKQSAISIPWFNRDGTLVGIRYRFLEKHEYKDLDGEDRLEGKGSTYNSDFTGVFGWQAIKGPSRCNVLIITEGELNAPSLWQAGAGDIDVLSAGSESTMKTLSDDVVAFAQQYAYRIVWADKRIVADDTARLIKADLAMASPVSPAFPKGQDANDLLQAGKLVKLLTAMLKKIGADIPVAPEPHPVSREEWQQLMERYGRPRPAPTRPPLPPELWQTGMNESESWRIFNELSETYRVAWDSNEDGYYVMAPTYG